LTEFINDSPMAAEIWLNRLLLIIKFELLGL
jgi:hypothetical protein